MGQSAYEYFNTWTYDDWVEDYEIFSKCWKDGYLTDDQFGELYDKYQAILWKDYEEKEKMGVPVKTIIKVPEGYWEELMSSYRSLVVDEVFDASSKDAISKTGMLFGIGGLIVGLLLFGRK